ncbi:MAG: GNAT family N-acetyltransferase [Dehalococcoidia bacterium]
MTGPPYLVEPLTDAGIADAARLLTGAFLDDPLWTWLIPDRERRRALHPISAIASVRWGLLAAETYVTVPPAGVAIWVPPAAHNIDLDPDGSRTGWSEWERSAGPEIISKFEAMVDVQRPAREQAHDGPGWYLAWLGVLPDAQRTGAGSALLRHMFRRTDAEGMPCLLETENEANVKYYQRHGFRLMHEGVIPLGGPPFWTMKRDPP